MDLIYGHSAAVRPFPHVDRRTRAWRRRGELIKLFTKQLHDVSDAQFLDIERLADLIVLAESKRAAMLAGKPVKVAELTKLENSISRLKWSLGLTRRRRQELGPDLKAYLKERA
jgi:hypothetical protein